MNHSPFPWLTSSISHVQPCAEFVTLVNLENETRYGLFSILYIMHMHNAHFVATSCQFIYANITGTWMLRENSNLSDRMRTDVRNVSAKNKSKNSFLVQVWCRRKCIKITDLFKVTLEIS